MVREFDDAVFGTSATGVLPQLGATRYRFHVVLVERRIGGGCCRSRRSKRSSRRTSPNAFPVQQRAVQQYVQVLARRASIEGGELRGAASPLVQ
jgi:peptidyl-prolyl cis-trans isomerase C